MKKHKRIVNKKHRMTITFDKDIYHKINQLKSEINMKSYSREVNILLDDELSNQQKINQPLMHKLSKKLINLTEQIGQINKDINGACDNLNQIAYDLNLKKYKGGTVKPNQFLIQNGLRFREDIQKLKKHDSDLKVIRKKMNEIWRYVM